MKRILSLFCAIVMLIGMLNLAVFASEADAAATNDVAEYSSLQAAVDDYTSGIIILQKDALDLTVTKDVYLDLNGHDITGSVSVTGGTLYCLDSQTDDFTVADGNYGKLTGKVTGNVAGVPVEEDCAMHGYLMVKAAEGISFHCVNLEIYAMTLRASDVGVYYKSYFAGDEVVAKQVKSFGVALSIAGAPTAENLETKCGYSVFENFKAGDGVNGSVNGTLLYDIMKQSNTDNTNGNNARLPIYGRAYIKTANGYLFGNSVKRSLQQQVEAVDGGWKRLTQKQRDTLTAMYECYTDVMDRWEIPNIQTGEPVDGEANITVPIPVSVENGVVTETVDVSEGGVTVTVPAGVVLAENADGLTLKVTKLESADIGVALTDNQVLVPMDVHVDGISADNTVPLTVHLGKVIPENLNMGNYTLYHVENGETNEMTLIPADAEFTSHNQYKYTLDGEVILYIANFSVVAAAVDGENTWNGEYDYSWYNTSATELEIRNADQLAGFSAIVGGMDGKTADTFAGKTVKLLADIKIGDTDDSENGIVFYPIGYYNSDGTYERTGTAITSGFKKFEGTFDGNGNTISDFYQNTWEMKGDNNYYAANLQYYRDGMGLFGKVYGGTVKNLIVENFSSDGEYTTTGTIAAYADCGATFENIAIRNCNPRVYNIGNGGIVGCVGWYANDAHTEPVTFKNITVDNTNKISALWGSWDVACGGLVGQYYPTSGQENTIDNGGIKMENCHVAAQIDVYNDVCANYQYYAYRYAGILIGSVRENETIDGHVYPKMDDLSASGCTVHFGDWNDYYYCELVANSLASYTHDHQMSRLEQVRSVDSNVVTHLDGTVETITGTRNFVVVNKTTIDGKFDHATENATCYHFVDGAVWTHEQAGTETVDGVEGVLKEDKQHIYREFNNLVTGYGWGVTSKGVGEMDGVAILDKTLDGSSKDKFAANNKETAYACDATVKISDLFKAIDNPKVGILSNNVQVTVSPAEENSEAGGKYTPNIDDWTQGTLTFSGEGLAKITITDYYYCTETTIEVTVMKWDDASFSTGFNPAGNNGYAFCEGCYEQAIAAGELTVAAARAASLKKWTAYSDPIFYGPAENTTYEATASVMNTEDAHYYLSANITTSKYRGHGGTASCCAPTDSLTCPGGATPEYYYIYYATANSCFNLNGFNITLGSASAYNAVFYTDAKLNIINSAETGGTVRGYNNSAADNDHGGSSLLMNNKDAVVNLYAGTFVRYGGSNGVNMRIGTLGGTVNMYTGVTLRDDTPSGRAGSCVAISGSTDNPAIFNMYGGEIVGKNTAKTSGSNNHNGKLVMVGALTNGKSHNATFNLHNGNIHTGYFAGTSGSTARANGGLIAVAKGCTFNMLGGNLYDGKTSMNGGAVYLLSGAEMNMSDGKIYDCAAETLTGAGNTSCKGGGVYVASGATLNVTGGSITGNTATNGGNNIYAVDVNDVRINGGDVGGVDDIFIENSHTCDANCSPALPDDITEAFTTGFDPAAHNGWAYCEACYKQAIAGGIAEDVAKKLSLKQWEAFDGGNAASNAHYYLENNVENYDASARFMNLSGDKVCWNLNGKTVSMSNASTNTLVRATSTSVLNIMDSSGDGRLAGYAEAENNYGATVEVRTMAVVNIYGGIFGLVDGSAATTTVGCSAATYTGALNIYGGTFNGRVYARAGGTFKLAGAPYIETLAMGTGVIANIDELQPEANITVDCINNKVISNQSPNVNNVIGCFKVGAEQRVDVVNDALKVVKAS